jgi:tRNA dimethylallyltransferase
MKRKLIVIGGPTAVGKTDFALKLAKRYNGELINADSRQIYKFLSIGTNKGELSQSGLSYSGQGLFEVLKQISADIKSLTIKTLDSIPIHLIDFLEPDKNFNAFDFKKLAYFAIDDIFSRNKLPILVGGTGLYIDAVVNNYFSLGNGLAVEENYRKFVRSKSVKELQILLMDKSQELFSSLNYSDQNNPVRLQRILEKIKILESQNIDINKYYDKILGVKGNCKYNVVFLYKRYYWDALKKKIEDRVNQMFEEGIISETEKLLDLGYSEDCPALTSVGYKYVVSLLKNNLSLEECKIKVSHSHIKYARKQKNWFEGKNRNYNLIRVDDVDEFINSGGELFN